VLGEKGRTIKEIGQSARHEISKLIDRPVHLFLFVKVRENWAEDPDRYRPLGLDFPKES
jgi:GTP-binding protein Era